MAETPFGFFNLDKPLGMTSHTVVAKLRRLLNIKKVGHAGTLDPLATGVLVMCVGPATRLSEYAMSSTKRYMASVTLGVETTTYDAEGEIVAEKDATHISLADVEQVLPAFTGEIDQLPPLYSAIKKGGRKLYEIARAGETVEREVRQVTINSIQLLDWSPPVATLDVVCGAGTYIRSLAYDIGVALDVGGHLSGLQRTQSGVFHIADAVTLDELQQADDPTAHLLAPDVTLQDMPALHMDQAVYDDIRHGRFIENIIDLSGDALARAYGPDGTFVALLRVQGGLLRPHKVFSR